MVLIGGLNGGGKTTILDAVQLALYGPRAHTSKRDGTGYENYLRACINRGVDRRMAASVAVHFRYVSEGEEHAYEVRRQWSEKRTSVHETISVSMDGEYQEHLSKHWGDIVEELIPIGISRLFF
ncbi:MAG: AAA family ATPase [Planctomycetaceae bacterium]